MKKIRKKIKKSKQQKDDLSTSENMLEESETKKKVSNKKDNPKAFTFNSAVGAERRFRRKKEIETKRHHIPLVDRVPSEPPPVIVAVVGPPNCGKSTLIKSILKLYNGKKINGPLAGPITIVIGKKRRLTLIECNNDINSMIDIAKIADLVYVMCDASFGFEMEVFEFLNICQVHGMPRIMGVLTHLDNFKNNKTLRNTKRILKHRFWTEVYQGAKLFSLSKIGLNGEYLKNEVSLLIRYVNFMKFRPLMWRSTHSYILVDRFEDLTSVEIVKQNPKCDRTVCFYGYVRGIPLNKNNGIHIAGIGDTKIENISFLPDPCPLPGVAKKRALDYREKLIYAPFSGVGGIVYDKDAVYIDIGGSHSHKFGNSADSDSLKIKEAFDNIWKTNESNGKLQIFSNGLALGAEDVQVPGEKTRRKVLFEKTDDDLLNEISEANQEEGDDNVVDDDDDGEEEENDLVEFSDLDAKDSDNEDENSVYDDDDVTPNIKWKENLYERIQKSFHESFDEKKNLMKYVYGKLINPNSDSIDYQDNNHTVNSETKVIDDMLSYVKHKSISKYSNDVIDNDIESSLFENPKQISIIDWTTEENKSKINDCFMTGKWNDSEDAKALLELDDLEDNESNDNDSDSEQQNEKKALLEKKMKLKEKFDLDYDNDDEAADYYNQLKANNQNQAKLNQSVFENLDDNLRVQFEGFRPGMYVRIEIKNMSCEFTENFDPHYPILIGGLNVSEENIGFVDCNIKRNRWYPKILKTNDPVMISLGWRRFQSMPTYTKLEDDLKFRYLKYTPEHVTCNAHFWGPITPQNTGILFYIIPDKSTDQNTKFAITATGNVRDVDKSAIIVKKLKLVGHPMKIFKKTAFITGMFNSALEVAKFQGGRIKTVSGIRGQIKKAESKPEGCFRATFEDKIKMSDVVFCRTWFRVNVSKFYNPATNLLMPKESKSIWTLAKTVRQIKDERGIKVEPNMDHLYTDIHRREKKFKPLKIPKKLQKELPYVNKTKYGALQKGQKAIIREQRVAVIKEPKEHEASLMIKELKERYNQKLKEARQKRMEQLRQHKKIQKENMEKIRRRSKKR